MSETKATYSANLADDAALACAIELTRNPPTRMYWIYYKTDKEQGRRGPFEEAVKDIWLKDLERTDRGSGVEYWAEPAEE